MGRNIALHQAPGLINSAGSSLAKIFAGQPASYQKGQQLALMQALQQQQINSGAATQAINENKLKVSSAINSTIQQLSLDPATGKPDATRLYQKNSDGSWIMASDGQPMLRPEVAAALSAAVLPLGEEGANAAAKIRESAGYGKPSSPVHLSPGDQVIYDPHDQGNPNYQAPSKLAGNAIAGAVRPAVTPEMKAAADPAPGTIPVPSTPVNVQNQRAMKAGDDGTGIVPGAGGAPVEAKAVPFDSPIANAATAGAVANPNIYNAPPKPPKDASPKIQDEIASNNSTIAQILAAKAAANANPNAVGRLQNLPLGISQYFQSPDTKDTVTQVQATKIPIARALLGPSQRLSNLELGAMQGAIPNGSEDGVGTLNPKFDNATRILMQKNTDLAATAGLPAPTPIPTASPAPSPLAKAAVPSGMAAPTPSPTPFQVKTPDDFHALAPGTQFTTPDGRVLIKQ